MTKNIEKLFSKLALYKNDDAENSDFHEYGYEEIESILEHFIIQDWKALDLHWKSLTEIELIFLTQVLTWWHIDEDIADIQIKIAFDILFSKNNKIAQEALFIFKINENHFNKYPQKIKIKEHDYLKNKKEVFFKTFYPKPSILRTEKASEFLKKHFTKKVFDRLRFLNNTYTIYQKEIYTSLTLIASKFLKKDDFQLYELIKNEFIDKKIPENGSLPLIGNTNFMYGANGISGSFQLFWSEITSIAIEIRENYYGEQQGICFSGLHHLFVPDLAENFDRLAIKLQNEFSIAKNIFDFSKIPNYLIRNNVWRKQYEVNAHIIENGSFLEKRKWKKDSKNGFYIVHNGKWLEGEKPEYVKPSKQLIPWNTSIQELADLPNSYYKQINGNQSEYKQMYFDTAVQIASLLIADAYYDYPNYYNHKFRKDSWFEGFNARLHFEIEDTKAIQLLKKEFTSYFGKPEKLNSFVYDNNPLYTLWNVSGILISINLNPESGINLKIVNSRKQLELSQYKEEITLSDTFLFSEKVTFHIQNWKENKYAYEIIEPEIFKSKIGKNSNGFIWRDDINQTIGIYDKKKIIHYTLFAIEVMIFPIKDIKQIEIIPVKSWATDFCYLSIITNENKHHKIVTYNGSKTYFNGDIKKLENFFGCKVKLMEEEEDMH